MTYYLRMGVHARTIAICEGAILLMHRWKSGNEYFVIPGGNVEDGERIEDAALRELFEETGLRGSLDRVFFEDVDHLGGRHVFFLARDVSGLPTLEHATAELSYTSTHNRFRPEWVPLRDVAGIALLPEAVKALILRDLVPSDPNG